jgi:3-deoxy-D-manno-octulosonic-acid transferase
VAARPLCRALKERYPTARLLVTTTTVTGQAVAMAQIPEADLVDYYPLDWTLVVRRMLDRIEPELVILMESELWLNFLSECRGRGIPVVVANGRISDRSFPRSLRVRFLVRRLYGLVTRFVMQSEVDAARAIALGARSGQVVVGGNLKYDVGLGGVGDAGRLEEWRRHLPAGGRLIIAGSTHPGEEEMVLGAFRDLQQAGKAEGVGLLIAPRHPERFGEVAGLIEAAGWPLVRRSAWLEGGAGVNGLSWPGVILLDSIGELATVYELATVVLVGGSLLPIGGHNILEPALAGKPIVVGPHMHNFREMTAGFRGADALIQLTGSPAMLRGQLRESWERLLGDPAAAQAMGERARRTVEVNRGATARTCQLIAELLPNYLKRDR